MKGQLSIRKINKNDVSDLFDLLNNIDKKTKIFFHPHPFDRDTIKSICESEKDYYYVMTIGEKIIGYSFLRLFGYTIPSFKTGTSFNSN